MFIFFMFLLLFHKGFMSTTPIKVLQKTVVLCLIFALLLWYSATASPAVIGSLISS